MHGSKTSLRRGGAAVRLPARRTPASCACRRCPPPKSSADPPPLSSVALQQLIRLFGAPRARGIVGEVTRGQGSPYIQDRRYHSPARLNHVSTLEQRGITGHAIIQQPFITCTGGAPE